MYLAKKIIKKNTNNNSLPSPPTLLSSPLQFPCNLSNLPTLPSVLAPAWWLARRSVLSAAEKRSVPETLLVRVILLACLMLGAFRLVERSDWSMARKFWGWKLCWWTVIGRTWWLPACGWSGGSAWLGALLWDGGWSRVMGRPSWPCAEFQLLL